MVFTKDGRFVDESGRTLLLRGANLGGDCKTPASPARDGRPASFVGRPFAEEEARAHFARLARWGLRFERFLVTWEAIEGAGPGEYDRDYLDYATRICEVAAEEGVELFVDPHQDVWSRATGGDGAPEWTLELAGFDPRALHSSGAAFLESECEGPYPPMRWPSNYNRLACQTMFTLFFAGDVFAPSLRIEGKDARTWLQERYFGAMRELARRLERLPNVHGFDTLNEPNQGYVGLSDIRVMERAMARVGPMPSPLEAMAAGAGLATEVDFWGVRGLGQAVLRGERIGTPGVRAWKPGVDCLWAREGVWRERDGRAEALAPEYFSKARNGARVDFSRDCLEPFVRRFAESVCGAGAGFDRRWIVFVEGVPNADLPRLPARDAEPLGLRGIANASHWYDSFTLYMKRWTGLWLGYDPETARPAIGPLAVRRYFREHLGRWKRRGLEEMGGLPTLVGEFGLAYDIDCGRAFRDGDYRRHADALSEYHDALDDLGLSATIWNFTATNRHSTGDGWNGEDLSIWNRDEFEAGRTETGRPDDAGGRAVAGFARPYARAVAGLPLAHRWRRGAFARRARFVFEWKADAEVAAPTELFVPAAAFPRGFAVRVRDCLASVSERDGWSLVELRVTGERPRVELTGRGPYPSVSTRKTSGRVKPE